MREFLRLRLRSFQYAFAGWWCVLRTQRNAHIHALATICVITLAFLLKLPGRDWAILVLTIGAVWTAECINTAIEATIDLISPQKHPLARMAKDAGAAAVLIAALCSIAVGLLVLGPPLWRQISLWLPS